jgi:Ca2+-binding RTX toxin-like protein
MDFVVSSSTELRAALLKVQGGDTIELRPGTYSGISITSLNFAGGVQIKSADPSNPAKLLDLKIDRSSGVTISGVEMDASGHTSSYKFLVTGSNNVHFDNVHVHGSLDGNSSNDVHAFTIRDSSNVSVTNSEFQQLLHALGMARSDHITITGNAFHDIRSDGVRGAATSFVTISQNSFTDFRPIDGDHADAIQFYTANTTVASHNITITNNLITRGNGLPMQGIFLADETGTLPYQNVAISGNLLVGTNWNGIAVMGGKSVRISDNVVAGFGDTKPWIRLDEVTMVTVSNNQAMNFVYSSVSQLAQNQNITIAAVTDGGAALLHVWESGAKLTIHGTSGDDTISPNLAPAGEPTPGMGDDTLYGYEGADTLDGGLGSDSMSGGAGNDTYYVDHLSDVVSENVALGSAVDAGGTDRVSSTVSTILSNFVENLTLSGSANINGTGNSLANRITGNAAENVLRGASGNDHLIGLSGNDTLRGDSGNDILNGGLGSDTMSGGAGNDTYHVDHLSDVVTEDTALGSAIDAGGTDRVSSTVSLTLGSFVENLTLTNSARINGHGNSLANSLLGNDADNILKGAGEADSLAGAAGNDSLYGGAGNDVLVGGTGADYFCFDYLLSASDNVDKISDFNIIDDTIRLDDDVFIGIGSLGTLLANSFYKGTAAHDADDRVIYDSATGQIYFDRDGSGTAALVLFARVDPALTLTNLDFLIVG